MKHLSINNIRATNKDGRYTAIGSDGKKYDAVYNANLKTMFFCIPLHIEILYYTEV